MTLLSVNQDRLESAPAVRVPRTGGAETGGARTCPERTQSWQDVGRPVDPEEGSCSQTRRLLVESRACQLLILAKNIFALLARCGS